MKVTSAEIEEVLQLLAETPRRIASASTGLENARLHFKADDKAWSANDILAHLRSCADVWGKSILAMIAQDNPTLRYVSPRTWMPKTDYLTQEFHLSLQAFATQRTDLVQSLKALAIEDWSRTATFTGTVKGREQTIFSYARRIAVHENEHCEQIEALLK
jgi:DinB superfamily